MDSTPTRRIPNDAQLGAVHTAGGPGMEATVEQEAGNLPKRAVQAQLRHEHDVGGRIRAQQPRPAQHLGPQQAELRVDVAHPLEQLLKPHAGPGGLQVQTVVVCRSDSPVRVDRSEEHTSELQSRLHLVCRLLLEKKKKKKRTSTTEQPRY